MYNISSKSCERIGILNYQILEKCTEVTEVDINQYLSRMKELVQIGHYTISRNENRQANIDFIEKYRINTKKEKKILWSLTLNDFHKRLDNDNLSYPDEKLYVFIKKVTLDNWGFLEEVELYIKMNLAQNKKGQEFLIVVSFHE